MIDAPTDKFLLSVLNSNSFLTLGMEYFKSKRLQLGPFPGISIPPWGNWETDPLSNRSWQWRYNWLSFISFFIAYHHSSHDVTALEEGKTAILSWLDTYLHYDSKFEFAWHDHGTALRAEQILLFLTYCQKKAPEWSKKNTDFTNKAIEALYIHGNKLSEESFYSRHTNHGVEQTRVLMLLGLHLKGKEANGWVKIARIRLKEELDFSFTEEGVHVENSPGYHIFVFKVFLNIIKEYSSETLGTLGNTFDALANKSLEFITHILRPDCTLPIIGDTEHTTTTDAYADYFGTRSEYRHFSYALSAGKRGDKPTTVNKVYPKSGYAIFRDHWPDAKDYIQAFHIIIKVGCLSRYHHQQDEGHIAVFAGGEDWLIDSGLYNYANNDPIRKYMRSRLAHNVPIITQTKYPMEFEDRFKAWSVTQWSEDNEKPFIKMRLDVLQPVRIDREVSFHSPDKTLKVKDEISSSDNEKRNITLQWHVPRNKNITINNSTIKITNKSNHKTLTMSIIGDTADEITVASGARGTQVFSVVSYKANTFEQSQVIRILFNARKNLKVETQFQFTS